MRLLDTTDGRGGSRDAITRAIDALAKRSAPPIREKRHRSRLWDSVLSSRREWSRGPVPAAARTLASILVTGERMRRLMLCVETELHLLDRWHLAHGADYTEYMIRGKSNASPAVRRHKGMLERLFTLLHHMPS